MSNEEIQKILSEFNKQFNRLRDDLSKAIEKLSEKIADQTAISISTSKDVEAMTLLYDEKLKEMRKDIDNIAKTLRENDDKLLKQVDMKIKESRQGLVIMFWMSVSSGTGALLMIILKEFVFKG